MIASNENILDEVTIRQLASKFKQADWQRPGAACAT